jgi:hypothetical protein
MFEFMTNLGSVGLLLLLVVFILFILAIKRVMSIVKNALIIGVASMIFPVVLNVFLGFDIPIDSETIMSFLFIGLGIYFLYLVAKSIYSMFKIAEKVGKAATAPLRSIKKHEKKKFEKKVKEHMEKEDEEEEVEEPAYRPTRPIVIGKKEKEKTYYDDYTELEDPDAGKRIRKKDDEEENFAEPLPEIKPKKRKNNK